MRICPNGATACLHRTCLAICALRPHASVNVHWSTGVICTFAMTTDSNHGENYPTSSEAHVHIPLREHYTRSVSQDQLNYRREQFADGRRTARGTAGTADTAASPAAALASATCATRCWDLARPNLAMPWSTPGTSAGRHARYCKEALERTASPSNGRHSAAAGIVKPRGKQWRNCSKKAALPTLQRTPPSPDAA